MNGRFFLMNGKIYNLGLAQAADSAVDKDEWFETKVQFDSEVNRVNALKIL